MRILIAAAAMWILCFAGADAQDSNKKALADEIHDYVMEHNKEYDRYTRTKAMVLCVDWDSDTPSGISLHMTFSWVTEIGSDVPIFTADLRRRALRSCKGWRAKENVDCDCEVLDEDGKNRLKVP